MLNLTTFCPGDVPIGSEARQLLRRRTPEVIEHLLDEELTAGLGCKHAAAILRRSVGRMILLALGPPQDCRPFKSAL